MSVRELIMLIVGIGGALYALREPYVGLLLLVILYFFRPSLWGGESYVTPVEWITIGTLGGWLLHKRSGIWHRGALWLFLLLCFYSLSSLFAPFSSQETWAALEAIAKIFVVVFLLVALCDTPSRLAGFVAVVIGANLCFVRVVMTSWLATNFSGSVRIDTGIGQGGGANYIAWVLATTLPFLMYKMAKARGWQRWAAAGLIPLWLASIIATGSRGGLLCVVAASLVFLLLMRQAKVILAGAALALTFFLVAPGEYWERMNTITTNPEEMDTSALGRYQNALAGLSIIQDYPLFGTGLQTFPMAKMNYVGQDYVGHRELVAHNTYIQMGSELGLPFLLIFLLMNAWIVWHLMRRSRSLVKEDHGDYVAWVRAGILSALAATAVQMVKGDMAHIDYFWWLYGVALACVRIRTESDSLQRDDAARRITEHTVHRASPLAKGTGGE